MSSLEQQQEEIEVLRSIYDGDHSFKEASATCFQYKYGEDGNYRSFILEVNWGETYPEEPPSVNMELFYNKHILKDVKDTIIQKLQAQMQEYLGMQVTFTLFDWVKDNLETLIEGQPSAPVIAQAEQSSRPDAGEEGKKKERKEQMTKAQKRRHFDKFGAGLDRPRGWDWVDVVKHLSQTGGQQQTDS